MDNDTLSPSQQKGYSTLAVTRAQLPAVEDDLMESLGEDEQLSFELYVPSGAASEPPGLLVYISPKPGARMPPDWAAVLDAENLVWIGANDSGNEIAVTRRVALALLAPLAAAHHAAGIGLASLNAERTFLSGFSGGGRVASMMMPLYYETYRGAIYICGANPVEPLNDTQLRGLSAHRFVFLTGNEDFNHLDTQFAIGLSQRAGLGGGALYVVDGLDHALPDADPLARSLRFLQGEDDALIAEE